MNQGPPERDRIRQALSLHCPPSPRRRRLGGRTAFNGYGEGGQWS
jgi:hypothetical protein